MTAATLTAPRADAATGPNALRMALLAIVVVALIGLAFVLGRVTDSTTPARTTTPVHQAQTSQPTGSVRASQANCGLRGQPC